MGSLVSRLLLNGLEGGFRVFFGSLSSRGGLERFGLFYSSPCIFFNWNSVWVVS